MNLQFEIVRRVAVNSQLTIEERLNWLGETLHKLAEMPTFNDDEFAYIVFEELDVDVRSCLHTLNLNQLVRANELTITTKHNLTAIRTRFLDWIDEQQSENSLSIQTMRNSDFLKTISLECNALLATHGQWRA